MTSPVTEFEDKHYKKANTGNLVRLKVLLLSYLKEATCHFEVFPPSIGITDIPFGGSLDRDCSKVFLQNCFLEERISYFTTCTNRMYYAHFTLIMFKLHGICTGYISRDSTLLTLHVNRGTTGPFIKASYCRKAILR